MKSVLLALVAATTLAVPTAAHAEVGKPNPELAALCPSLEKVARQTMKNRQGGVSMSAMMNLVDQITVQEIKPLMTTMIMQAYEETQWHSDSVREDAANRYAEKWSLTCYKIVKGEI